MKTDFKGKAKKLEDKDLPRIGARIRVGEDEIHAFMDVEAAGSGFDNQGRPKMRFEYHYFYKRLKAKQLQDAIKQRLAYKSWRSGKHPRDMYPILQQAIKINPTAALQSASWGLGQIMGSNYKAAGYPTVQAMVKDFMADEDNHLEAMVNFLIANHLDDDLRDHRWSGLARGYNGPAYASHGYHTKLAAAYKKWSRIKDTPFDIEFDKEAHEKEQKIRPSKPLAPSSTDNVRELQALLSKAGFKTAIDGISGKDTDRKLKDFQQSIGISPTGIVDESTLTALRKAAGYEVKLPHKPVQKKSSKGGLITAIIAALAVLGAILAKWANELYTWLF